METLKGVFTPMITIFDEKGELDWEANQRLIDWLIEQKVTGLVLLGSTGEFSSLTSEERKTFVQEMIAYVNERAPVLVGTGSTSFIETLELSKQAESVGAKGVLVVNPYYLKFSDDQLYLYFSEISESISIPVILYNIPELTGQNLSVELIYRLAMNHPNIVGIKETVKDISHIRQVLLKVKQERPDFLVFAAYDDHVLPALQLGADGSISSTTNFVPALIVDLFQSFQNGEDQKAIGLQRKIAKAIVIYEFSNPFFLAIKEAVGQVVLDRHLGSRFPAVLNEKELSDKVSRFLSDL